MSQTFYVTAFHCTEISAVWIDFADWHMGWNRTVRLLSNRVLRKGSLDIDTSVTMLRESGTLPRFTCSLATSMTFGRLETSTSHAQLSPGRAINQTTERFVGYDYLDIGGVSTGPAFTGLSFRF